MNGRFRRVRRHQLDIPLGRLSDSKKYSGKWTKAFWICPDGEPEYDKIAKNICLHLFGSKRLTIGGSVLEGSLATRGPDP